LQASRALTVTVFT